MLSDYLISSLKIGSDKSVVVSLNEAPCSFKFQ